MPAATERSWSKKRPPSENESGVTFRIPITWVLAPQSIR